MRKFKIPTPIHTTIKTIRFPDITIEKVEKAIQNTDCSFSAFVVEACNVALENLYDDIEYTHNIS